MKIEDGHEEMLDRKADNWAVNEKVEEDQKNIEKVEEDQKINGNVKDDMHTVEVKEQQVIGPRTKHIDGNDARMHFTRNAMTADKVKGTFVLSEENESAILTKNVIEKLCPIDNVADLLKLNVTLKYWREDVEMEGLSSDRRIKNLTDEKDSW
jgi:hypothetical protein